MRIQGFFSRRVVLACVLSAIASAVWAQSTGRLYDPMPPDDSAYLRGVLAPPLADGALLLDGKVRVDKISARTPGEYLVVPAGMHRLQAKPGGKPSQIASVDAAARSAYTVVFPSTSSKPYVFRDKTANNRLKAMLAVYHAAPLAGAIDVLTADGATKVFSDIQAGTPAILEVNPIQVKLIVVAKGKTQPLATVSIEMERGAAYSVFVFPASGNKVSAVAFRNQRERYTGD